MASLVLELAVMLVIILLASELFTNALEHLGATLKISEGVTASLFVAVGTAPPIVPLLAIFAGTANQQLNEEVGVGAILGAPLMLSTLSTCLMAVAVFSSRGADGFVNPERLGFVRDLDFFLFAFVGAAAAMFVPEEARYLRASLSAILVTTYFVYALLTSRASEKLVAEGHGTRPQDKVFLSRIGLPENVATPLIHPVVGLALLVFGAKGFINGVEGVSALLGMSALLVSLLIIPIATELRK